MTNDILDTPLQFLPGVGPQREKILKEQLGLTTFGDLLGFFPHKYIDRSRTYRIGEVTTEMPYVQIVGEILSFEVFKTGVRKERVVAHFTDGERIMDLTWFGGGRYAMKSYKIGVKYIVFGKPSIFGDRINVVQPDIDPLDECQWLAGVSMQPYYRTTEKMKKAGFSSRIIERYVKSLFSKLDEVHTLVGAPHQRSPQVAPSPLQRSPLRETLTSSILDRLHLMDRSSALHNIHFPETATALEQARIRLKFEELFFVQLNILRYANDQRRKFRGFVFSHVGQAFNGFYHDHLPFPLTEAQKRVIREMREDMRSGRQMNRLLQGDVGSGKTLVALMLMLLCKDNGYQACLMAPTEILAEQHLATLKEMTQGMDLRIELLTGQITGRRRKATLEALADGSADILVGTHAVIEDGVRFLNLGLVVIDEQHRFGVEQRAKLWQKNAQPPHVMVMTATPIPRTLAMTLYGDLDVSVIDELPPGRKPIETLHVYDSRLSSLYESIRSQVRAGRQAYIVFPLIEESEKTDLRSLEEGFEALREVFAEFRLGKVHGRLKPKEKDEEMRRFVSGETQILVATTVIEVGVNVPNASVMVILDAGRFGLSQLHQLRGRVGRGADQSYCILVTPYKLSDVTRKRIDIMCETNDGFRIAEADLQLRGPGDLEGTQQSGMAFDLKIANLARDGQIVQMARDEASRIIEADPECRLPEHAMLWQRISELRQSNINWSAIS